MPLFSSLDAEREQAEAKAWKALAGYKFMMFGYWAAVWVHLNTVCSRSGGARHPSPFTALVKFARGYSKEN